MEKAQQYVQWDPNEETRAQVQQMIDAGDSKQLDSILKSRLAFGTAGLRGPMGPGYNRMNDLVILQTTQGLARYLVETQGEAAKEKGIVIGYDHRKFGSLSSLSFARISAAVFLSQGFKVYCFESFVPTPFVAFGVNHFHCAAGIMVTASHNPKRDNGFKVYWNNGSQIIPPHDSGIAAAIANNLEPWHSHYDIDGVLNHPLAVDATEATATAYFASVKRLCLGNLERNARNPVKVAYTAMHGVGKKWVLRCIQEFHHAPLHLVEAQCEPDPEFTTVSFPNPEEKGALNLAMEVSNQLGCTVIIANDPDADRLALAEKVGDAWKAFTGNEIGVILGHWMISQWKNKGVGGVSDDIDSGKQTAVLASVVSSRMLRSMAKAEGFKYYDTLTGFKWLGNRTQELRHEGTPVVFSYEEALGYCLGDVVADKDGVCAASVVLEMVAYLAEHGMTLTSYLQSLYTKYGEFVSYNSYVFCHDPKLTDAIFHRIRHGGGPSGDGQGYWTHCAGHEIVSIKDVTLGYDSSASDHKSDLPVTPDSHMIMFEFDNGCSITLRTSGTEPKIKFYTEIAGRPSQDRSEVVHLLKTFVDAVVEEMLEPTRHGLARP